MSIKIEIKHKGVSVWITERTVTKNGKQYSEYVVPDYTGGKRVRHVRATEKDAKAKAREVCEARATGNSIERRVIVDDNLRHDVRRSIVLLEPFGVGILAGTRKLVDALKVLDGKIDDLLPAALYWKDNKPTKPFEPKPVDDAADDFNRRQTKVSSLRKGVLSQRILKLANKFYGKNVHWIPRR